MAQVIWTEPALSDLEAIADYVALEDPRVARKLVRRIFEHIDQLEDHPDSGSRPSELKERRYRQIIEPPCRVFYRHENGCVYVLYVMRSARRLRQSELDQRDERVEEDR